MNKSKSPASIAIPKPINAVLTATSKDSLKKAVDDLIALAGGFDKDKEEKALRNIQTILQKHEETQSDQVKEEFLLEIDKYSNLNAVENGRLAESSVDPSHKEMVQIMRESLIQEHHTSSVTAKLIIDMAITAYSRSMRCSAVYTKLLNSNLSWDSNNGTSFLRDVGKQINIANQQFYTAITFLEELSQPTINVKVQAKQTFVGQNQQFNSQA